MPKCKYTNGNIQMRHLKMSKMLHFSLQFFNMINVTKVLSVPELELHVLLYINRTLHAFSLSL